MSQLPGPSLCTQPLLRTPTRPRPFGSTCRHPATGRDATARDHREPSPRQVLLLRRRGSGTDVPVRTLVAVDFLLHERVRSGDRAAFAEIFDEHARVVHAHAIRTTGDWALAKDVMSLTFLEAWRLRDKLREEVRSVRAWLWGIAPNVMPHTARAVRDLCGSLPGRCSHPRSRRHPRRRGRGRPTRGRRRPNTRRRTH
ncbi:RNA polymerase sigma factor [Streptomyces hirsutus]|uniref:RNA polymerase sigma factor n=1 Tax=Streptomyces hirsutus TaxID=35620 RepID=UPI00365C9876